VKPKTRRNASVGFDSALLILVLAAGCGAPGEPRPPTPPVPVAITDLTAHQAGEGVQLTFTLPTKTISGDPLAKPPAIEVLRLKMARTSDLVEQKKIAVQLQRLAIDEVTVIPLGERSIITATRKNVRNQVRAAVPVFWNMTKS